MHIASSATRRTSAPVRSHLTRTCVACAHAPCHLPSEKSRQDTQHLGGQVGQSGLDLLVGPGSIAHLQGVKAEATLIVVDKGEVGVALRRLPEGAVQEDAGRVDAERRHQALPESEQSLFVEAYSIRRWHQSCPPILSVPGCRLASGGQAHPLEAWARLRGAR